MEEYFKVGQIVNTHGIKGEVKVIPLTDDVNNFKSQSRAPPLSLASSAALIEIAVELKSQEP